MNVIGPSVNSTKISLANERLDLVYVLAELQPQYVGDHHLKRTNDGRYSHPWLQLDSLQTYLLLTCFDVLGAKGPFLDFQSWLESKRAMEERNIAVASISPNSDSLDVAKLLHKNYLKSYGVSQSFFRFIRDVLPPRDRSDLMDSIRVTKDDISRRSNLGTVEDPTTKEQFLFDVRNKFTHEARDTGSLGNAVFPEWPKSGWGWDQVRHIDKGNVRTVYWVLDWPAALRRAVAAGIRAIETRV